MASKKRKVAVLSYGEPSRNIWPMRDVNFKDRKEYIIQGLSVIDAIKLYQETGDEKYVNHVFFSNLGYFLNAIAKVMDKCISSPRYTDARDYLCYAYEAVKKGMQRFNTSKYDKVLSYLSGAIYFDLRKHIEENELRFQKELGGLKTEEEKFLDTADEHASLSAYKEYSEATTEQYTDDVKHILEKLFEHFKSRLAEFGVRSVQDLEMIFRYGLGLNSKDARRLSKLKADMMAFLRENYNDWFL